MKAGDAIEVLKEHLPDGWSLVSISGEAGLIPQTYYTVSVSFWCEEGGSRGILRALGGARSYPLFLKVEWMAI
jgi:hypothetical protein